MISCARDEVVHVVNDKKAIPNLDNARTIDIWALLELAGKMWACVKTDWIAMVRDLPLAKSDLNELFNAESTVTCEHFLHSGYSSPVPQLPAKSSVQLKDVCNRSH